MKLKGLLALTVLLSCAMPGKAETENISVQVGDGTTASTFAGFGEIYEYYASQTIYTTEEINQTGTITRIAFQISAAPSSMDADLKIYMGLTDKEKFNLKTDQISSLDGFTLVYDGSKTIGSSNVTVDGSTQWEGIDLTTPYDYSGAKNLAILISSSKSAWERVNYCGYSSSNKALVSYSETDAENANVINSNFEFGGIIPNTKFTFQVEKCDGNHTCATYSATGFGICSKCKKIITSVYQPAEYSATYGYNVKNAGNLFWVAQQVNQGSTFTSNDKIYCSKDINLSVYDWTPIGTASYPFNSTITTYDSQNGNGHIIKGIASNSSLIGYLGSGTITEVHLADGKLAEAGNDGYLRYNLTLADQLIGDDCNPSTVVSSFFHSEKTDDYENGGRTTAQLASGVVAYELNEQDNSHIKHWRETIGTDEAPTMDSTRNIVYRYTKCDSYAYTNSAYLNGTKQNHFLTNGICNYCGMPTYINQDVEIRDARAYMRTTQATVDGTLTYTRTLYTDDISKWQTLYLPISFDYSSDLADYWFDIATVEKYANGKLYITTLGVGETVEANQPYLIRPKRSGICSITSNDGILYAATINSQIVENDSDQLTITGNYSMDKNLTNDELMYFNGGQLVKATADSITMNQFRWSVKATHVDGTSWTSPDTITIAMNTFTIVDDGNTNYSRTTVQSVDIFTFKRECSSTGWGNKWQTMYLPVAVTITPLLLSKADFATISAVETRDDMEVIVVSKLETGYIIPANTPFLIRVNEDEGFSLSFAKAKLQPAATNTVTLQSDHATYEFTGTYDEFSDATDTWYGISRSDGLFHPAKSTAKLAPFRFYMKIAVNVGMSAAALRFGIQEVDANGSATAIQTIEEVKSNDESIYSLNGQRIEKKNLGNGLYIMNGKKMLIRK